jgi:hypothetical protein
MSHPVLDQNQMLIVCMPKIKLSYIWPECKHRKPMSLLYHILLQKNLLQVQKIAEWAPSCDRQLTEGFARLEEVFINVLLIF